MKVLMIGSDRKLFEEESVVRSRILEYGALVDELHIIVFSQKSHGFTKQQIAPNVWLYPTDSRNRFYYPLDAIRVARTIKKDIDLITTQDPFESGYAGLRIAKERGAKLHVQIHTDFLSPYFKKYSFLNKVRVWMARMILPQADGIRVVSRKIADSLADSDIQIKSSPDVLPIFVDLQQITRQSSQLDLHERYPQFDRIILTVSRITPEKNIEKAVTAMKDVVKEYPQAGLVIVGEGASKEKLIAMVKRYHLQDNIIFEPWSDDVISYYKTADIFLNTSHYEGYGMTLIEAAVSQCSIVTTDVGIAREFFEKTEAAFICAVNDENCVTVQLKKLLESDELRQQLGRRASEAVNRMVEHDKKTYLEKYAESWKRCL